MPSTSSDVDPRWAGRFALERERLAPRLPGARIEHVGPTSVPVGGRDVIDIQVVTADVGGASEVCARLRRDGFELHVLAPDDPVAHENLAERARRRASRTGLRPLRIVGHDLPGRSFEGARNVHVGVQRRSEVIDLVPGDAESAEWEVYVDHRRGPYVHGRGDERFVYLSWGELGAEGSFEMFRRAKLHLPDPLAGRVAALPERFLRPPALRERALLARLWPLRSDPGGRNRRRLRAAVSPRPRRPPRGRHRAACA